VTADLLAVGLSARALCEAALRAGVRPVAVDFFGDLDLRRRVRGVAVSRDLGCAWDARAAALAAGSLPTRAVAYAADLENAPAAVARLARGRELLGNPPAVLRQVRDPGRFFGALSAAGVPVPATVLPRRLRRLATVAADAAPDAARSGPGSPLPARTRARGSATSLGPGRGRRAGSAAPDDRVARASAWLRKPRARGGGLGIRAAPAGSRPGRGEILQELLEGPALGLSFVADGREVRPLALAAAVEDRAAFGAPPFAYCGSLTALPGASDDVSLREQALAAARAATRAFGLRGWGGMDFVLRRGELVPVEVNPRHTASMDLVDTATEPLFALHAAACRGRVDPEAGWLAAPDGIRGKAVLWAREDVIAFPSEGWPLARDPATAPSCRVADVPFPGDPVAAGRPVCTLYAAGASAADCLTALRALAARVQRDLVPAASLPTDFPWRALPVTDVLAATHVPAAHGLPGRRHLPAAAGLEPDVRVPADP
jgi:predicted ATP-grasp superfamily ATP-dependent carboligase